MPRVPRRSRRTVGDYYHVMNRGHNRAVAFAVAEDHAHFLCLLDCYRARFAVRLLHFCLIRQ